jgi:hypothetical protein
VALGFAALGFNVFGLVAFGFAFFTAADLDFTFALGFVSCVSFVAGACFSLADICGVFVG